MVGTVVIVAAVIIGVILSIIFAQISGGLAGIVWLLTILIVVGLSLAIFGGAVFAAIKAYGGEQFKLPIVGNMAEKWV